MCFAPSTFGAVFFSTKPNHVSNPVYKCLTTFYLLFRYSKEMVHGIVKKLQEMFKTADGKAIIIYLSKWRNIWIRDVLFPQHLWCQVPTALTKTRLEFRICVG